MKHLILGSSGQIGAHLVKYLVSQKQQVFEWDILNKPFQDLRQVHSPILDAYIEDCDIVIVKFNHRNEPILLTIKVSAQY